MQPSKESLLIDWITKRQKALLTIFGLVVLIGITLSVNHALTGKKMAKAASAFNLANEELTKELKDAGTTAITDVDRQLSKTVAALQKVTASFSGTSIAWEAQFKLADLYFKYEALSGKAAKAFEAATKTSATSREKLFALYSLAYAYEKQGKIDDAIKHLDQASGLAQPYLNAEILLSRARLLVRAGKTSEARKLYEQVSKDFANTDFARKADEWKSMSKI